MSLRLRLLFTRQPWNDHELEIGESEVRESECVKTNLKRVQRCNLRNVYQILMRLVSLESWEWELSNDTSLVQIRCILSQLQRSNARPLNVVFTFSDSLTSDSLISSALERYCVLTLHTLLGTTKTCTTKQEYVCVLFANVAYTPWKNQNLYNETRVRMCIVLLTLDTLLGTIKTCTTKQ